MACALEQIQRMHNWDTQEGVRLQLHLGLGAGSVTGVDLGNQFRREYVVAGDPLKQLSEAEQQAHAGQLVVSPEVREARSPMHLVEFSPKPYQTRRQAPPCQIRERLLALHSHTT